MNAWIYHAKTLGRDKKNVFTPKSDVSKEKIAQRERHLKELRDNIVSVKRAKREDEALKAKRAAPPRPSVIASASPAPTRGGTIPEIILVTFSVSTMSMIDLL